MELAQWFETTIQNADLPPSVDGFRFIFIPAVRGRDELRSVQEIARELGLEYLADISSAAALPSVLAAILLGGDAVAAVDAPWRADDAAAEIATFVENMAFSRLIPIWTNPLDLRSLATVLTTGSGVAIGAWAGVVASGGSPLILITVPVGMVIGGAAAGVGRALESGLQERLGAWLRPRPPSAQPSKPPSSQPRGVHTREIRLAGDKERNYGLLYKLKSIPGVEDQTRFLKEENPEATRIKVWSAEPIAEHVIMRLVIDTDTQILAMTDDIVA